MQKRYKSKVMWMSLATLLLFLLKNYGLLDNLGLTVEGYNELINLIFAVAVGVGIINDPHSKNHI